MHNVAFLQDLAVVMLVAGVVTVVFHWLKQPVVLGYILAGAVIGPHLLPRSLVTSPESVQTLAALGLVFLLFTLGLEFNLRKLQALSMLLSELAIREHSSQQQKIALRTLLSNTILFAGAVAMSVLVLALSAPLLPPWEILLLLCGLAALLAILLRAYFVRLYARAQTVIRETLARAHPPTEPAVPRPLPPLLDLAGLRTIRLAEAAQAAGKSIGELRLRTRSGASVIAVRRGEETTHNPDPEFVLAAGDELLLLGNEDQLRAGEALLNRV